MKTGASRTLVLSLLGSLVAPSAALAASASHCAPLPAPSGDIVTVSTVSQLVSAVDNAVSGRTILVANGTYALNGAYLRIDTPNVTVRSQSGNRSGVVLDGNYQTTEIFQIVASNVTIADLTLREAYYHPIHVAAESSPVLNTLIYNVHVVDPGEQAIKVNPTGIGAFADYGTVACSRIELTDAGRPQIRNNCYTGGIDVHAAVGWTVRDNEIEGFWCPVGLSEHAVHFWRNARDTVVERNLMRNNARGVGFGMADSGTPSRTYADNPCPEAGGGYVDHFGGVVRNNMISADGASLFASEFGFDCGICFWQACRADARHNTVFSANVPSSFSSIEWRFSRTSATLVDNLVNFTMRQRDGAVATQSGNLTNAQASWFTAPLAGDLHLTSSATAAIDHGVASGVTDDFDGDLRPRGSGLDVGADETGPPSLSISDVSVVEGHSGITNAVFQVRLSGASPSTVTVDYATADGTAVAGSDYTSRSGTASLLPGTTSADVTVPVLGDTTPEWIESFRVNLSSPSGADLAATQAVGVIVDDDAGPSADFHAVTPCRRVDTRSGSALLAKSDTRFVITGGCGIPATAKAVSLNLTITGATAAGNLRVYPARTPLPLVSVLNYSAGQTRANSAVATLNDLGELGVRVDQGAGSVHVIVDVNGYFE